MDTYEAAKDLYYSLPDTLPRNHGQAFYYITAIETIIKAHVKAETERCEGVVKSFGEFEDSPSSIFAVGWQTLIKHFISEIITKIKSPRS